MKQKVKKSKVVKKQSVNNKNQNVNIINIKTDTTKRQRRRATRGTRQAQSTTSAPSTVTAAPTPQIIYQPAPVYHSPAATTVNQGVSSAELDNKLSKLEKTLRDQSIGSFRNISADRAFLQSLHPSNQEHAQIIARSGRNDDADINPNVEDLQPEIPRFVWQSRSAMREAGEVPRWHYKPPSNGRVPAAEPEVPEVQEVPDVMGLRSRSAASDQGNRRQLTFSQLQSPGRNTSQFKSEANVADMNITDMSVDTYRAPAASASRAGVIDSSRSSSRVSGEDDDLLLSAASTEPEEQSTYKREDLEVMSSSALRRIAKENGVNVRNTKKVSALIRMLDGAGLVME
jgi:hypothetical protein